MAVHDRSGRILAYSSHEGPIDNVRSESILTRRTRPEAYAWSLSHGIEQASGPVRIPPNREVGMEASRICAPIRFDGGLLGFLWLVDPEATLSDDRLPAVQEAADTAALAIHREHLMEELERGRGRDLLRVLVSDESEQRAAAADELMERNLLVGETAFVALVARPVRERASATGIDEPIRAALEAAMSACRQLTSPGHALQLIRRDHGLIVVALREAVPPATDGVRRLAGNLHDALTAGLRTHAGWGAVVGVGDAHAELADVHGSYRQARQAAEVGALVDSFGPIVQWSEIGVYRILLDLPLERVTEASLHPGLVRLMGVRDAQMWLDTLEGYFDSGCDARATAAAMHLQRGSLYHRLNRIEQLADVDLSQGDDRLGLHLGLKLARLIGLLPLTPP